ncbi:MAG: transglutaminase domain-containing protein [Lysobacteraceae bacterium]|nr:MAG: transglutaminase domain-containing protein [Xanthomonadaceae bacterium]
MQVQGLPPLRPIPSLPKRRAGVLLCMIALFAGAVAFAGEPVDPALEQAISRIDAGGFAEADRLIATRLLANDLDASTRADLLFQRERMRRIHLDFTLDAAQAKAALRKQIPDLTDTEFDAWDAAGLLERQDIDGRRLYFKRAPSNLFRLSAQARARRANPAPFLEGPMESANDHHRQVRDAATGRGDPLAAMRRIRVTQSLTVDADAVPAGETVRAWIPYPRAIPGQQEDLRLVSSQPAVHAVAPESALQRTVYLEKPARAGEPTAFSITYEVTLRGQYHAIDADKVVAPPPTAELAPFLEARPPHVVFTPAIREFSRKVVGEEKNPYRIAQKLFAAVDRIPWAGAREYSTISNLGDYALHAGHADCGQQTLLLITLLRLNGIPARWQSGMVYSDGDYDNLHDWGALYLAPYGWVPMDVSTGRLEDPDPQIAGFYLGGQDAYRIAFNDDYSREFVPAKQHFRSETVDLQRGEAEWKGGNLYFDQWDYGFAWERLPLDGGLR